MNNELYIEQLLDDYLQKKLPRTDTASLLQKQGIDDTETEIDLHHAAAITLQRYSVLQQVHSVHRHFLQQQSDTNVNSSGIKARVVNMNPVKWILRIAAAVILIVGIWFAYLYNSTTSTALYAEIYQPYNVNTDRANVEEIIPHNMIQEFKEKNYTTVIETYLNLSMTNNREKFLAAVAYQETGNNTEAINLLNQILRFNKQQQSRLYNDEAEFYLALNYLKTEKAKQAIPIFQKIYDDPGHTFHERISKSSLRKIKWLD